MIKYAWQIPDKELVYIDNVENGIKCNCICPKCSAKLNAKNGGNILDHHFSHINTEECSGAAETVLHLLAKDVFLKTKSLMLPRYKEKEFLHESNVCRNITFDEVLLEKDIQAIDICIRPDAVAIIGGKEIYVEFANNHFVDDEKKDKIKSLGIECLEIDIRKQEENREKLICFFNSESSSIYWINNPEMENLYQEYCDKKVVLERKRIEQESYSYESYPTDSEKEELKRLCWAQRKSNGQSYDYNEKRIEDIILSWRKGDLERFAETVIELLDDPIIARKMLQYVGTYQETRYANDFLTACYMWQTPFDKLYNKINEMNVNDIKNHETLALLWKIGYTHHQRFDPDYIIDWADPRLCYDNEKEYLYDCFNRLENPNLDIYLALLNIDNSKILNIIGCIKYNHIFFGGVRTWKAFINSNRNFSQIKKSWGYIDIALDGFYYDGLSMRDYLKKSDSKKSGTIIRLERSDEVVDENSVLFKALSLLFPDVYKCK